MPRAACKRSEVGAIHHLLTQPGIPTSGLPVGLARELEHFVQRPLSPTGGGSCRGALGLWLCDRLLREEPQKNVDKGALTLHCRVLLAPKEGHHSAAAQKTTAACRCLRLGGGDRVVTAAGTVIRGDAASLGSLARENLARPVGGKKVEDNGVPATANHSPQDMPRLTLEVFKMDSLGRVWCCPLRNLSQLAFGGQET